MVNLDSVPQSFPPPQYSDREMWMLKPGWSATCGKSGELGNVSCLMALNDAVRSNYPPSASYPQGAVPRVSLFSAPAAHTLPLPLLQSLSKCSGCQDGCAHQAPAWIRNNLALEACCATHFCSYLHRGKNYDAAQRIVFQDSVLKNIKRQRWKGKDNLNDSPALFILTVAERTQRWIGIGECQGIWINTVCVYRKWGALKTRLDAIRGQGRGTLKWTSEAKIRVDGEMTFIP